MLIWKTYWCTSDIWKGGPVVQLSNGMKFLILQNEPLLVRMWTYLCHHSGIWTGLLFSFLFCAYIHGDFSWMRGCSIRGIVTHFLNESWPSDKKSLNTYWPNKQSWLDRLYQTISLMVQVFGIQFPIQVGLLDECSGPCSIFCKLLLSGSCWLSLPHCCSLSFVSWITNGICHLPHG